MPKVLVSNNSQLLRHLASPPFRRLSLDLLVVSSGDDALTTAQQETPQLAIIEAELPGLSGYEVAKRIKADIPGCKVVMVMGKRIHADQMQKVAESGCDEVLIVPMSADELYDVVSNELDLPRHGSEKFSIELVHDHRVIDGHVTNLSIDGARLVLSEPVPENTLLDLIIRSDTDDEDDPITLRARVVWAQRSDRETVVGASFEDLAENARARLAELTQWEIVEDTERTRIVIKGDITEATSFDELLPVMVGRVDFDLSQVRYMNSLGVREWVDFLNRANVQGYEFHTCSCAFILQASMVEGVLGRGTVTSFFAPYHCHGCDRQEEKLLQSAAILAANYEPPTFTCPDCDGQMSFDDIPERYLGFLRPATTTPDD
ncbi:MAG: response regulator [Proteobacteria bacterium]|nr:response regulator [Pseudomonadota bacterium]